MVGPAHSGSPYLQAERPRLRPASVASGGYTSTFCPRVQNLGSGGRLKRLRMSGRFGRTNDPLG